MMLAVRGEASEKSSGIDIERVPEGDESSGGVNTCDDHVSGKLNIRRMF
jgi:hypothetical protein